MFIYLFIYLLIYFKPVAFCKERNNKMEVLVYYYDYY